MTDQTTERRAIDRDLLRRAGEHLGTLAEQAKETRDVYWGRRGASVTAKSFHNRFAKLSKLSQEVLEIANG